MLVAPLRHTANKLKPKMRIPLPENMKFQD